MTALVVLAAGLGTRYGGLKALAPVGPSGEALLDYALYDARRAGFTRAVLVVRRDTEARFRRFAAQRVIQETPLGEGYLLADVNYETNPLYDQAATIGRVMVTPRRFRNAKGLGQSRTHSRHRIAMIQRMKDPSPFVRDLLANRREVETRLANLTNFGGGLTHVPPWVRGRRVAPYVTAKICIRLARDQVLRQRACA